MNRVALKDPSFAFHKSLMFTSLFAEGNAAWKETDAADKEAKLNIMSQ